MKKLTLTIITLFAFQISFSQIDSVSVETELKTSELYIWKGSCYDKNGNISNPGDSYAQIYQVKKFKSKTPIEINIKKIKIGSEIIKLDILYKDKIGGESKLIMLNESFGLKIIVGKTIENQIKKYVYKLIVFKMDKESECWRPLTMFNTYYDVQSKSIALNSYSMGYPDSKDYFQIEEGWITFD